MFIFVCMCLFIMNGHSVFFHVDSDTDVLDETEETNDIDIERTEDVPDPEGTKVEDQIQNAENGK